MIKVLQFVLYSFLMVIITHAQVEDRLRALDESQVNKYIEPMATAIGMAFNSGSYNTADIPSAFSFFFGFTAPVIIVPESQTTFTPDLPQGYINNRATATIFGNEGGYYAGPQGYIVYPPGINETIVPAIMPQVGISAYRTRLLIRFVPYLDVGETKVFTYGAALSHSISQYIPGMPFELAVQGLFSSLNVKDISDQNNLAFNIHGSKEFGIFTLYSGIQYETSSMDLSYTFRVRDPVDPNEFIEREISASLDGTNFRFTVGGSIKLSVFRIHADLNAGPQFLFNQGITLEF